MASSLQIRNVVPSADEHRNQRSIGLNLAAAASWRLPGRFGLARVLGPSYSLRCLVFHDVSPQESIFTRGMGVSVTPAEFEKALRFLVKRYNPVRLEDVIAACNGRPLPPRPVLLTFDDGYASVMEWAAPLCIKYGVPGVIFLNAGFLDNVALAPDNLVCYVANVLGMEVINAAVLAIKGSDTPPVKCLVDVFSCLFPSISLVERRAFLIALACLSEVSERELAREAALYLTHKDVRDLAASGFEIGNHTYSHVRARVLSRDSIAAEISENKAALEYLSGKQVRAFSLPYGSSADLSKELVEHLKLSGHEVAFLSESVANTRSTDRFRLDRVSMRANRDDTMFFEIEILPRLRALRNRFACGRQFFRKAADRSRATREELEGYDHIGGMEQQ
jgi:peptidoglycan/xylan/chitin deacetylase (PgdA/CDA1 family)